LNSLPESLGNLTALTRLFLENNQLSSLPESLGKLDRVYPFDLNDNPWMFVSDKERNKISNYRTYRAVLEQLKKYTPQSPIACLFHAIIFNKPLQTIEQAYFQLSPGMQQRIATLVGQNLNGSESTQTTDVSSPIASSSAASSSSGSGPSQESLFTDRGLFARSVRTATYDLYNSLGIDQKKLVHSHIWDLAGRPETNDTNWGEQHVFDHVLRFTDALARATQN
jgi:hypothetical protein